MKDKTKTNPLIDLLSLLFFSAFIVMNLMVTFQATGHWDIFIAARPFLQLTLALFVSYCLLFVILKNNRKAAAITLFFFFLSFQYKLFLEKLHLIPYEPLFDIVDPILFVITLLVILFLLSVYLILKYQKIGTVMFQTLFAYLIFFTVLNSYTFTSFLLRNDPDPQKISRHITLLQNTKTPQENMPDIYYVIFDGYAANTTLERLFDYNNEDFYQELRRRGFFTIENGRASYIHTMFSISSTLNMNYIQNDLDIPDTAGNDRRFVAPYYIHPRLVRFLKKQNYDMELIINSYNIDKTLNPDKKFSLFDYTSQSLLGNTPANFVLEFLFGTKRLSNPFYFGHISVNHFFDLFEEKVLAQANRPKFVFAHLLPPHPPFILNADGTFADYNYNIPFSAHDGEENPLNRIYEGGWNNFYKKAYVAQVQFVNKRILEILDAHIQQKKKRPVVFVLQSDHGSRMKFNYSSLEKTDLAEIFYNFNALYYSDQNYTGLPKNASPINTLRHILNKHFGQNLPMVEDRQYYSTWLDPFDFIEVTEKIPAP